MGARVQLCGRLQLEWDGERLEEGLPGRQGRLLFTYLTLHRERPVRRDELVEALWSEEGPPPGGDALLRPPLSRLRRALGPDRLEGRAELSLRFPEDTWIDREAVGEGLRSSRASYEAGDTQASWEQAREALAIAELGLLPGLEVDWLEPFRSELEEQRVELLEAVARAGAQLGGSELHEAEQAARHAIEASPFRESARLALLEVLRRRGNTAEALVAFEEFRTFLRDELGSAPGAELRAVHEQLLSAEPVPRQPDGAATPSPAREERLPDRLAQAQAAPWVERGSVLARLRKEAAAAVAGESGLLLVVGEGGIGKTRLVAELAAELTGFDVLYGRCDEEEIFPYGPWVDMLRPRLERLSDAELATMTGPEAADLARLLPELRERLPDLAQASGASDPETERRQLFTAVQRLLTRLAAEEPLLIVVDDLHWADRSSLLLGRHLARQPLGAVLLVGTYRDTELERGHPLPELIADVERYRPVPRVRLAGMDEREVAALIGSWHGSEVEDNAVRAIRAETEGNPFFVKQLVRHLEEAGDGGEMAAGAGLAVPEGVRDVIARRVARLPDQGGHVLQVAALIGRDFDYELLARVVDLSEEQLLNVLDAAVRGALLAEIPSAPGSYSFAHALVRSAVEFELSATRRGRLHARIGEAIEQLHRSRLDPWLDDLARHFAETVPQEVDRAVDYAARAAAQAVERLAYDEAAGLLERAVALRRAEDPVDHAELARLEIALATAEAYAGRWETARASFARAADVARAAEAGAAFARAALGHSGGTWEQFGRDDAESVALLEEALQQLPADDSSLRSQLLARLAVLLYYDPAAPQERVREAADTAVEIARRLDDDDALVAALTAALYAHWRYGLAPTRLELTDELIALTEARESLAAAADAHFWRAGALLELCRLEEAEVEIARQAEIAERSQQVQLLVHRKASHATLLLLKGDFEAAAVAVEEEGEEARRSEEQGEAPMPLLLAIYGGHLMGLLNERGELGAQVPFFERLVREMGGQPGWRSALAWAQVQEGRLERGRGELEELSADGFAAIPRDINFVPCLAICTHAIGELGDRELASRAEPLLAPYRELWIVTGTVGVTLGPVAYALGVLQLAQERPDDAVPTFEEAMERAASMRARPYVARSQAGLAEALRWRGKPGDAERAEELAELAATTARELGMTRLQRELEPSSE